MPFRSESPARRAVRAGLPPVFPRIWRYAVALTGSRERADDLAQSVCLRAMEQADKFEPGTRLDRWLFRMTHNLWVSELRKTAVRQGGGLLPIDAAEIADPRQDPEADLMRRDVMLNVLRLPEAQRHAVMLVYVEGYSYRDAAEIMDIPLGTVMSRLATARSTLGATFRGREGARDAK